MSMMSCQADQGARYCCHGKFIRTGMRIFVWKTVEGLKEKFGLFVDFEFLTEIGAPTNRFPLV